MSILIWYSLGDDSEGLSDELVSDSDNSNLTRFPVFLEAIITGPALSVRP